MAPDAQTHAGFFVFDAIHILFILKRFAVGEPLGLYVIGFAELAWHLLPARRRPSRRDTVTDLEKTANLGTEMSRSRGMRMPTPMPAAIRVPGMQRRTAWTGFGHGFDELFLK